MSKYIAIAVVLGIVVVFSWLNMRSDDEPSIQSSPYWQDQSPPTDNTETELSAIQGQTEVSAVDDISDEAEAAPVNIGEYIPVEQFLDMVEESGAPPVNIGDYLPVGEIPPETSTEVVEIGEYLEPMTVPPEDPNTVERNIGEYLPVDEYLAGTRVPEDDANQAPVNIGEYLPVEVYLGELEEQDQRSDDQGSSSR